MITVNYETAKRLKEAGWNKPTYWAYIYIIVLDVYQHLNYNDFNEDIR